MKEIQTGRKTLWEKEKLLVTSNFSFSHSVFKRLVSQGHQKVSFCGNGLILFHCLVSIPFDCSTNFVLNIIFIISDETMDVQDNWGFWIKFISTPIIVIIGIIGNTLSVVVMKSKMLRNKSYSHYLCTLAFFDTLTLVIRLIRTINEYYMDELNKAGPFQSFNNFWCKLYNYVEHCSYLMSSWLIVLMAIERLIAVCFPFKKVIIRKQTGAAIGIFGVFVLVCLSQSFRLIMVEHVEVDQFHNLKTCAAGDEYLKIYSNLDVYFYSLTLTFILPLIIVLSCNCLVLHQIFKIRQELKAKDKNSRYSRIIRSKNRTTCMLLAVSFTYIVALLPLFTITVFIDICVKTMEPVDAFKTYLKVRPFLEVSVTISLINYACNFFIYILSGKSFRFELRKMFNKERKPKRSFTARSTREEFIKL